MRRHAALTAALLALAPAAASAAETRSDLRAQLLALQALDARVQNAGWRLVRGNAPYCRGATPAIGVLLQDAAGYDDPAAVREALGLSGDIAIAAAATNSPTGRTRIAPNTTLIAVSGQHVAALPAPKRGDFARLAGLNERLEAQLAAQGLATFELADGTALTIAGEPACPTRFEVLSKGDRAAAEGKRVVIGRRLVEALPEDELLAAALAHELAHNLLGHRARLDHSGRSWGKVKATEREADRLMPWLLANAGYPPEAAIRFFERWGPKHDLGILSSPDHDRWQTRIKRISAELGRLRASQARRGGAADWAKDF